MSKSIPIKEINRLKAGILSMPVRKEQGIPSMEYLSEQGRCVIDTLHQCLRAVDGKRKLIRTLYGPNKNTTDQWVFASALVTGLASKRNSEFFIKTKNDSDMIVHKSKRMFVRLLKYGQKFSMN